MKMKKLFSLFVVAVFIVTASAFSVSAKTDMQYNSSSDVLLAERGYQIIDGNVHDKYGNFLFSLDADGFTEDGLLLDPEFRVVYQDEIIQNQSDPVLTRTTDIYNGTASLALNTNGQQGTQLGSSFSFSSSEKNFRFYYTSGTVGGINIALDNITRGTMVVWFPNVQPGTSANTETNVYNAGRPNDTFSVKASAEGNAGNAKIKVQKY